jgi:hypothetical protein
VVSHSQRTRRFRRPHEPLASRDGRRPRRRRRRAALEPRLHVLADILDDSIFEERESWNVISETEEGIMLGAHLDSVQAIWTGIKSESGSVAPRLFQETSRA